MIYPMISSVSHSTSMCSIVLSLQFTEHAVPCVYLSITEYSTGTGDRDTHN